LFSSLANFKTSDWHICWIIGDFVILTTSRCIFWLSGVIFPSLGLNKIILDTMECLKCIIKCLYQFIFKIGQFLDFKLAYLWIIADFVILASPRSIFWLSGVIFPSLRLYKKGFVTVECLKCIIKCVYQIVFRFVQFLDFKLTYLSNYWWFCDFYPIYRGFQKNISWIG